MRSTFLVLPMATGARAVVEVDGAGLVWGNPKSHEARWVPVGPMLAAELAEGRPADDLLFTALGGGVLRNRAARRF